MSLIPAKCTQCGTNLMVDESKDAAVCPACGTPFVTEKAINNYNTTNITNIENLHADVIKMDGSDSPDRLAKSGDTFIMLGDYDSADRDFSALADLYPYDNRGWWGQIRVMSKNFTYFGGNREHLYSIKEKYDNFVAVSKGISIESQQEQFNGYYQNYTEKLDAIHRRALEDIEQINKKYEAQRSQLQPEVMRLSAKVNEIRDMGWIAYAILAVIALFIIIAGDGNVFLVFLMILVVVFGGSFFAGIINGIQGQKRQAYMNQLNLLAERNKILKNNRDKELQPLYELEAQTKR